MTRLATPSDAPALARLSAQLGYATSPEHARAHLSAIAARNNVVVLVHEREGAVVAWMELTERRALESGAWAEITGLVVDEAMRGRGIGGAMVRAARAWARTRGLTRLRVRTNETRAGAHRFYEREGFTLTKRHRVYDLDL